jgi:predicted nucleotidyltransferase
MVESTVLGAIRRYLAALPDYGIHAQRVVLFGSFARNQAHQWSDIDLIVIAPEFDSDYTINMVRSLWLATEHADNRIEPIPCGEREWGQESGRPIIEIARREGIEIAA